jgi:hypothetical protein
MLLDSPFGWQFILFIALMITVFYKWEEKPEFIRKSFWIALPLVVMAIPFGYVDEARGYLEVYPFAVLSIYHSLHSKR